MGTLPPEVLHVVYLGWGLIGFGLLIGALKFAMDHGWIVFIYE